MPTATIYAGADATVDSFFPTTNYGTNDTIGAVYSWFWDRAAARKSVLYFDLSSLPDGIALNPVLRLRQQFAAYTDGLTPTMGVFRLRVAFTESEVTYNVRSTGNNWTTAGIGSSASDYYSPADATVNLADLLGHDEEWIEIPLTTSLTKADLADGTKLEIDESTVPNPVAGGDNAWAAFYSKEYNSGAYKPELKVTYTSAGVPTATLSSVASITAASASAKTFVVTYADDTAVDYSSIATGNCTVTGPHSYSESATLVSVDVESDGTPRVATYSVPAPTGGWDWDTNGTYTITLGEEEVCDTSTNYVESGTLGTFTCAVPGAPSVQYEAYNASTGLPVTGDAANHTITLAYSGTTGSPWSSPLEVNATTLPGLYSVDLTEAQGLLKLLSLGGTSSTENVEIRPVLNFAGPNYVPDVNVEQIDGDADAPGHLNRELGGYARGTVFIDGAHAASTTEFWTTLPLRADGYDNMVLRFDDGDLAGLWCDISVGVTDGSYTKITLATALDTAPANGVLVTAGGNKE